MTPENFWICAEALAISLENEATLKEVEFELRGMSHKRQEELRERLKLISAGPGIRIFRALVDSREKETWPKSRRPAYRKFDC